MQIDELYTEAITGGQTPLLSTIELYDKLQEELPEFVKALIAKGNNIAKAFGTFKNVS